MNIPAGLTGKERIKFLVENKAAFIDAKKSQAFKIGASVSVQHRDPAEVTEKKYLYHNDTANGVLKRTIIANTYNFLDSHQDVHLNNLFAKSIAERGRRIPHLYDHKPSITAKVGRPIQYYEQAIKWRALGYPKNGETMALFLESEIHKEMNKAVYREYLTDAVDQHSVKMQYIRVDLAVNDENYGQEYKVWQEVYEHLGNKEQADGLGFFWAVREARLKEVSAVLEGSNELTPTLGETKQAPPSTPKEPQSTPVNIENLLNHYHKNLRL